MFSLGNFNHSICFFSLFFGYVCQFFFLFGFVRPYWHSKAAPVVKCNDKQTNKPFSLIALTLCVCVCTPVHIPRCEFLFLHFHGTVSFLLSLFFFATAYFHILIFVEVLWCDVIFFGLLLSSNIVFFLLPSPSSPPPLIFGLPLAKRFG